jgi:L-lactate dehydrogenase
MQRLTDFGVEFMTRRGVPAERARYVSRIAVETEAFRQSTHGLAQFASIDAALGKTVDPGREPAVVRRNGASAVLDGTRCLGSLAVKLAREIAVETARAQGVAFVGVRNTQWVGALGMHIVPIAEEGLLCQAWAQSCSCKDCAPFGGIEARFSTNPIAIAFPAPVNPVVADFSTSTMSMGAARVLVDTKTKTATPRFLDKNGVPSGDPSVIDDDGTLMFMGGDTDGHKGYGLSLMNEALTAMAGGSANNPEAESRQSFSLMVLDPDSFAGSDCFAAEIRRFAAHVKSSSARPGWGEVRLPGERGFAALAECGINGVPVDDAKLRMLRKVADRNGIAPIEQA